MQRHKVPKGLHVCIFDFRETQNSQEVPRRDYFCLRVNLLLATQRMTYHIENVLTDRLRFFASIQR